MLVPSNKFKRPSNVLSDRYNVVLLLWIFLVIFFLVCLSYCLSNPCSLVVPCWDRADLLALLFVMFSCVLSLSNMVSWGQVWYLIVSIPEICLRSCFALCLFSFYCYYLTEEDNKDIVFCIV